MNENKWYGYYYHDPKGKILGSISEFHDKFKALGDNMFLGWFITEEYAKDAVEEFIYNRELNIPEVIKIP